MSFCPNCGHEVYAGMNFCPGCGRNLADLVLDPEPVFEPEPAVEQAPPPRTAGVYQVILLSDGDCSKSEAAELLEDLLGYDRSDAKDLVKSAPVAVAEQLTETQARYLAQAMNEYGMEAAVYGPGGYVDLGSASRRVFDDDGDLLGDVARTLAVLSVANRVRRIERWMTPPPPRSWLAPRPPRRPPHRRRSFLSPPPPAPRRAAPPPPPRRPAPPPPARHTPVPGPRREPPRPAGPGRNSAGPRNPGPGKGPGGPSRGPGGRGPGGPGRR